MTFLIFAAMVASVLLVLVVLAQNAKGGGLSSQFGGSSASNLIGVKKTSEFLERLTWGLAIAIMVLALATNLVDTRGGASDDIMDRVNSTQSTTPSQVNPGTTTPETTTPPDSAK